MGETRQVEVDGKELRLTNLDKLLYPEAGFTKGEMVDYYAKVAPAIVPHLRGRAVTLRRFPEGVDDLEAAFFEKRCPKHRPKWVKTTRVQAGPNAGKIDFCVCDILPTLIWMAQLIAKQTPDEVLAKMGKKTDRSGKVLIDWYQNNERKTTIAVYSLRARERPTCSTPVTWEEVEQAAGSGDGSHLVFETTDVLKRLDDHGDLFAPVLELEQALPEL